MKRMLMLLLLVLLYCRVGITCIAGNNQDTKITLLLQKTLKSSISAVFEGQVSEKRSEHSFYPDHHDIVVHRCGDWEAPIQTHCTNPRSRSAAGATPASSNLAVPFFFLCWWGDEKIKVMRSFKKKKIIIQTEQV